MVKYDNPLSLIAFAKLIADEALYFLFKKIIQIYLIKYDKNICLPSEYLCIFMHFILPFFAPVPSSCRFFEVSELVFSLNDLICRGICSK